MVKIFLLFKAQIYKNKMKKRELGKIFKGQKKICSIIDSISELRTTGTPLMATWVSPARTAILVGR